MRLKSALNPNIRVIAFIIIFSLGKMIAAMGQTLFGMRHAMSYILKNAHTHHSMSLSFAGVAALCSLWVIMVTRIPAIYRQLRPKNSNRLNLNNTINKVENLIVNPSSLVKKTIFKVFIICSLLSGVFSALGAYLGALTLVRFIMIFFPGNALLQENFFIQLFAIIVTLSTFVSYYSFNFYKSKLNAKKILNNSDTTKYFSWQNINATKTLGVSILSIFSIPFLSYFLTKHALLNIPAVGTLLSLYSIQCIAVFSSLTALITALITIIPATYEYFVVHEKRIKEKKSKLFPMHQNWIFLRNTTYAAGFIDCTANGLSNFVSVIEVAHDAFSADLYGNIIFLAIGCGISSSLLTAAFSVRQGFNDFYIDYQNSTPMRMNTPQELVDISRVI